MKQKSALRNSQRENLSKVVVQTVAASVKTSIQWVAHLTMEATIRPLDTMKQTSDERMTKHEVCYNFLSKNVILVKKDKTDSSFNLGVPPIFW